MTETPAVCDLDTERHRRRPVKLVGPIHITTPCHLDHCNLRHPAGGDVVDDDGTPFKIHTSTFEHGTVWENLATGELHREVSFGDPCDLDSPEMSAALLREAANWLEATDT